METNTKKGSEDLEIHYRMQSATKQLQEKQPAPNNEDAPSRSSGSDALAGRIDQLLDANSRRNKAKN